MVDKLTYKELEQRLKDLEEESAGLRRANKGLRRAEKLYRKLSRRLRTLLDFIPYPLVVFTLEGHVYYLNSAFTQLFGWSFEELEGKIIPFVPPDRKQEVVENIKKLFEEKILLRHETKRLTKDERVLDVAIRASLYTESEDEPSGELAIFRDIT
ncbi:MAG: PAS domain S-box protein, partial [Desulfobacteraceae bacterium]|nr:PAS domain S-box protein [Desulfobacteraceae bacterium]